MPTFSFHLYGRFVGPETQADAGGNLFDFHLPANRDYAPDAPQPEGDITFGEYYGAARAFLEADECRFIQDAVEARTGARPEKIEEITIDLLKHGAFYHPACVTVSADRKNYPFVLNLAASDRGIEGIEKEVGLLHFLNERYALPYIPKVYGYGKDSCTGGQPVAMFIGDWFEGYQEFHLSGQGTGNRIMVWDEEKGGFPLAPDQAEEIYRQIAYILTSYYDPEAFREIFPWHHGAGDFIIRIDPKNPSKIDVRLVTVRGYGSPFMKGPAEDPGVLLQGLLIFLTHLSIRNRLDRLDGVGEVGWIDERIVAPTVDGFLAAIALKETPKGFPDSLLSCFIDVLHTHGAKEIDELCTALAGAYPDAAPETQVIRKNLKAHAKRLYKSIRHRVSAE